MGKNGEKCRKVLLAGLLNSTKQIRAAQGSDDYAEAAQPYACD
jgi:hypothetical protein